MSSSSNGSAKAYWAANKRVLALCLCLWAIFGFVLSIFFADPLNQIEFFGFKLGFWFAQQGAIYVFVALIFYYAKRMNYLDRHHDVHED